MNRRPRALAVCRTCPLLANERNMARGLLGAAVAQLGGRMDVSGDQWRALEGTQLEIEKHGDHWTVTSRDEHWKGRRNGEE